MIKLQWGKNIYICYNKKYLHEFIYSHEKCDLIYLRRVSKKVSGELIPFRTQNMATMPLCFEFFRCRVDVLQS